MLLTWFAEKLLAILEFDVLIDKHKQNQRSLWSGWNKVAFRLCTQLGAMREIFAIYSFV